MHIYYVQHLVYPFNFVLLLYDVPLQITHTSREDMKKNTISIILVRKMLLF